MIIFLLIISFFGFGIHRITEYQFNVEENMLNRATVLFVGIKTSGVLPFSGGGESRWYVLNEKREPVESVCEIELGNDMVPYFISCYKEGNYGGRQLLARIPVLRSELPPWHSILQSFGYGPTLSSLQDRGYIFPTEDNTIVNVTISV